MNHDSNRPRNSDEIDYLLKSRKAVDPKERLYTNRNGRVVVDHAKTANVMIKFIMTAPIHGLIKEIMLLRIGNPLMNEKELSHLAIALKLGLTESKVFQLEREGIVAVSAYMDRITVKEAVDKFNQTPNLERNTHRNLDKLR